ncbi:hypothetical protein CDL15_Pgr010675 [Punica granatum]|uniref:Uncharacterized protein n=1 Tax=Punica granatum TaxID=22663 RepID=A0A218XN07_PUNGR|nr:hypothetical protein CDL15_Pgr010675 [Punica granatum]PKI56855.1 hypothetical protein CRG98_022742 [Punica granatum]
MATETPSWADQWGEGGIGAMQEDEGEKAKKEGDKAKKESKAGAALKKIKAGTSSGFKWIKNQCQRKSSSK